MCCAPAREIARRSKIWSSGIKRGFTTSPSACSTIRRMRRTPRKRSSSKYSPGSHPLRAASSFRTWLYRIVVNHVLNMKRGRVEHASLDFAFYGAALDNTPELELADPKSTSPDTDLLVTEAMISCTSGMLLCLDREQRLTFILGAIFGVSDTVAAELLEITPDNFRQRLARARRDLRNFMNDKCGLVNQANPCRCAKKTRGFIQAGYVDPDNLLFVRERIGEVREAAPKVHEALSTLDEKCAEIFRGHPFYKAPDLAPMLRRLVARTHITMLNGNRQTGKEERGQGGVA